MLFVVVLVFLEAYILNKKILCTVVHVCDDDGTAIIGLASALSDTTHIKYTQHYAHMYIHIGCIIYQ